MHTRLSAASACLAGVLLCVTTLRTVAAEAPMDVLVSMASGTSDASLRADVLRGMEAALRGRTGVKAPEGWSELEARLAADGDEEVRRLTRSLGVAFGSARALEALRALAVDATAPSPDRNEALAVLLRTRAAGLAALLKDLVADPAVRGAALRGLGGFDDPGTPEAVLKVLPSLAGAERRDALGTLASRAAYARPLLSAVKEGRIPKEFLTADLVRQIRALKDAGLSGTLAEVWGVVRDAGPDMPGEIARVRRIYGAGGSQPGDSSRGRAVFDRICAQCHRLFDSGGNVGPDITGANRADLDYLLQNILFPNAVIPNEYRASTVEMKDERVITGILRGRDAATLTLQTANESLVLPASDVRRVETTEISMMPEGLLSNLAEQEIRDLLYYLTRPGQVPLPSNAK